MQNTKKYKYKNTKYKYKAQLRSLTYTMKRKSRTNGARNKVISSAKAQNSQHTYVQRYTHAHT